MNDITHHEPNHKNKPMRWLVVLAIVILFSVLLSSFLFFKDTQTHTFATQPWSDPLELCNTPWALGPVLNEEEILLFEQALWEADVPVREVSGERLMGTCYVDGEYRSFNHIRVRVSISVKPKVLESPENIGDLLAEVIQSVDFDRYNREFDMLNISFISEAEQAIGWEMNYAEALRAADAGLDGEDLYNLGVGPFKK